MSKFFYYGLVTIALRTSVNMTYLKDRKIEKKDADMFWLIETWCAIVFWVRHTLRVCLESTYLTEIEIFLPKVL